MSLILPHDISHHLWHNEDLPVSNSLHMNDMEDLNQSFAKHLVLCGTNPDCPLSHVHLFVCGNIRSCYHLARYGALTSILSSVTRTNGDSSLRNMCICLLPLMNFKMSPVNSIVASLSGSTQSPIS